MAGIQYDMKNVLDIPLWERMQDQLAKMTGTAIVSINISNFIAVFKRMEGVTPSVYRQHMYK